MIPNGKIRNKTTTFICPTGRDEEKDSEIQKKALEIYVCANVNCKL